MLKLVSLWGMLLLLPWCMLAQAQKSSNAGSLANTPQFDPRTMPVAIVEDSTLHLVVSEYLLTKSLKSRMPGIQRVSKIGHEQVQGQMYLVFWTKTANGAEDYMVNIPLYKMGASLYYAGNQSISCTSLCSGCKNCSCGTSNESCGGSSPTAVYRMENPLGTVSLSID